MNQNHDYSDFQEPATESGFDRLDELVREMRASQAEVEEAEQVLRKAQERNRIVREMSIPDLMDEMGLEEFKTKSGFKIRIDKNLRHSLSADRKPAALGWLEEHGHGDIIKRLVKVSFVVGEDELAQQLEAELTQRFGTKTALDRDVHSSTLKSLLKQLLESGIDVPLELFGAFEQRSAKIID